MPICFRAALISLALLSCAGNLSYGAETPPPLPALPAFLDPAVLIERLKSDEYDVRAAAFEKLASLGESVRTQLEQAGSSEDFETRSAAARLLALLGKPGIRVMLFDRNGKPVQDVDCNLQIYDPNDRYQSERSNKLLHFGADGVAEVKDLKPSNTTLYFQWQKCWVVGDYNNNSGVSYSNFQAVLRGGTAPFLFSVSKGGSVKGSLVDKQGKPSKEGEIGLYSAANFNFDMLEARAENQTIRAVSSAPADAQGNVLIEGVPDGVYICVATVGGVAPVEGPMIRVSEGRPTVVPPIEVNPGGTGKFVIVLRGEAELNAAAAKAVEQVRPVPAKINNAQAQPQPAADTAPAIGPAPDPALLRNVKLTVEEDYLFDGPDAEKKFRRLMTERMRYNRYRRPPQMDTDDSGKLTLESLRPGRHRIRIKAEQYAPITLTVDVPAGGAADLGEVKLDAGGSISGNASSSDGRPVTDLLVYPFLETETAAAELSPETLNFIRGQTQWDEVRSYLTWLRQFTMNRREAVTPDKLSVKNLAPGKYCLIVTRQSTMKVQQVYLVCGVNVESGKTTEIPPLKFAAPALTSRTSSSDNSYMKGKLIGPNKEKITQASVTYQSNNSSTGTSCNSDGSFQVYMSGVGAGGTLRIKAQGYKQAEFDCSAPGVDLNNIQITMERLRYGGMKLTIVDEDGRPLPGATLDAAPNQNNTNYYYYSRRPLNVKRVSDVRGEARFSGLSTGLRRINIVKDGYYLADPVRVAIMPDADVTATIMMRKGLAISGKLSGPEGAAFTPGVVTIRRGRDSLVYTAATNAAGEFYIGGLAPETYFVLAETPLLTSRTYRELELGAESKSNVTIDMVRKGGVRVQVDKAMKGRMIYLYEKDYDQKKKAGVTASTSAAAARTASYSYGYVDGDGCAEFWNVRPGDYRVSLPANTGVRAATTAVDDKDADKFATRVDCGRYSEPFAVGELQTPAEFKPENMVIAKFPEASASAVAKFVFRSTAAGGSGSIQQVTQYVTIKGDLCNGSFTRAQRIRVGGPANSRLQVVGTLPPFLAPVSTSSQTLIQNLVPGKYKISNYAYMYDSSRGTQEYTEEAEVAEFEVAAGERKNLGVIVVEPSKTLRSSTRRTTYQDNEQPTDEDLDPAFEP